MSTAMHTALATSRHPAPGSARLGHARWLRARRPEILGFCPDRAYFLGLPEGLT